MKLIVKKLNNTGFTHDVGLMLFVLIFAIGGVGYLVISHAASSTGVISSGQSQRLNIEGAYTGSTPMAQVGTKVFGWPINPDMEVPPWVVAYNGGWSSFLLSSQESVACTTIANLTAGQPINCTGVNSANLQTEPGWDAYTADTIPSATPYSRNYLGAFSGQTVYVNGKYYRITLNHGENKNNISYSNGGVSPPNTGNNYQNTVKVGNVTYNPATGTGCAEVDWHSGGTLCQSGATLWQDNESYSGFISSSLEVDTANNGWGNMGALIEQGPVVWPEAGYGPSTTGTASFAYLGVRHPYTIIVGNYLYVYYLDTSGSNTHTGDGSGTYTGIKVARSPISSLGTMGSWVNYDPSDSKWDLQSVPSNLTINNVDNPSILNEKGPQATPLWGSSPDTGGYVPVAFQVATIANDPGQYLGMETEYNNTTGAFRAKLRFSTDLVRWSNFAVVPATSGAGNTNAETSGELFSILLSNDGTSNTVLSGYNPSNKTLPVYVESSISSTPYIQALTLQL